MIFDLSTVVSQHPIFPVYKNQLKFINMYLLQNTSNLTGVVQIILEFLIDAKSSNELSSPVNWMHFRLNEENF